MGAVNQIFFGQEGGIYETPSPFDDSCCGGGFAIVVGVEFISFKRAVDSARYAALAAWVEGSEEIATQALEFVVGCMEGGVTGRPDKPERLMTIDECAQAIGGADLKQVIRAADESQTAPAPLRWL